MKKILYIWKDAYPWDVRVQKVCESLVENNYDVHMLSRFKSGLKKSEIINNINVYRVGFGLPSILTQPLQGNPVWDNAIEFYIRKIKPDLLIVREILLAVSVGRFAKKYGIPVVMDMAEHYPAAMRDFKKYNTNFLLRLAVHKLKLPDRIEKASVKLMDGIIVVCGEQIQRLHGFYGYPIDNIQIVHNTISLNQFEKKEHIPFINGVKILHHGWMSAEKSLTNLILGFQMSLKVSPDLKLILAGNGECEDEYKKLADKQIQDGTIQFLGKYDYNKLGDLINECDFGIIPYQVSDFNNYTIHNKIFDYFALGKPVVVSNTKPLARIVKTTDAGFIADCSSPEGIYNIIPDLKFRNYKYYSKSAYNAFLNHYNWENDSKNLIEFIKRYI